MSVFYRYWGHACDTDIYISYDEYVVLRETPKGVWLSVYGKEKFVLNGDGRRYAHPTKEAALASYRIRKQRQVQHLARQHDHAKACMGAADKLTPEMAMSRGGFHIQSGNLLASVELAEFLK